MARISRRKSNFLIKATELSLAAPQVIALRTAQMLAAGAHPSAADQRENLLMVYEKYAAFGESLNAMVLQSFREWVLFATRPWWSVWMNPWSMLGPTRFVPSVPRRRRTQMQRSLLRVVEAGMLPVHTRATRNARRLTRARRR
jgi:hypothetical protein